MLAAGIAGILPPWQDVGMPATEFPPDVAGLLGRLCDRLAAREDVVGVYVYGSLVTGDYSPAGQLHCLYVAADSASDPDRLCTYWFGDRMTQWQMKLLTQAELASAGVALYGPWPPPGIKPVPVADIRAAVHAEVTDYWRRVSRRRRCWLQDSWVDHGLVVLPRAEAVLTTGDLITKSEAIGRLADFRVPGSLAQEIRRRRDGLPVTVSKPRRLFRAVLARRIMQNGVARLSRLDPSASPAG